MNKQIINYNSKDYVIKYTLSKAYPGNIDYLKNLYTAEIAFANDKVIYFGEELKDLEIEEILYKDMPLLEVVENVLNDFSGYITEVDDNTIDLIIKRILYHKPEETEETIKNTIKQFLTNITTNEVQSSIGE